MEENQRKDTGKNDEIDLLELFSKMGNGIKNGIEWLINKVILRIIQFGVRSLPYVLVVVIIFAAIGYFRYKVAKPTYVSTAVLRSNVVPHSELLSYIKVLNNAIESNDSSMLRSTLGLSFKDIAAIAAIKPAWEVDLNMDGIGDRLDFGDGVIPADSSKGIRLNDRIAVQLEVSNTSVIPLIRPALINYISKNEYFNKLLEIKRTQLDELIERTKVEIKDLDSLQQISYFKQKGKEILMDKLLLGSVSEDKKQLFHRDIMELISQKQSYMREKEIFTGVIEVSQDFAVISLRTNTLMSYAKPMIYLGIFLGILLKLIIENRSWIIDFYRKSK